MLEVWRLGGLEGRRELHGSGYGLQVYMVD